MANGDEGSVAAWQVQDGTDTSTGSHDRKMSSFESTMLLHHQQQQQQQQQRQQRQGGFAHHPAAATFEGTDPVSIVSSTGENRPLPANFLTNSFPSSDQIGRLPTDELSSDVTRNRTRVDTTSAFGSSSSAHHQHHLFTPPSSHHENLYQQHQQQQTSSPPHSSYNIYNNNFTSSTTSTSAFTSSSDNHLDPSSFPTRSLLTRDAPSFTPSGNREAVWTARLSSGIDLNDNPRTSPTTTQSHMNLAISPSSTPLQNNLSKHYNIINNSNTSPTAAASPPVHQLPLAATTTTTQGATLSMGHNNNLADTSWALEEDKMERSTPEFKNRDGDDSTVQSTAVLSTGTNDGDGVGDLLSPASSPRVVPAAPPAHDSEAASSVSVIGTPSTVSTAPSTEDASLGTDSIDKIGLKLDPSLIEPFTLHRRAPSWDRSPISRNLYTDTEISASVAPREVQPSMHQHQQRPHAPNDASQQQQQWLAQGPSPAQAYAHHQQQQQQQHHAQQQHHQQQRHPAPAAWAAPHTTQSRVATFRSDDTSKHDSRGMHPYAHIAQQQRSQPQQMGAERWHQPRHFATNDASQHQFAGPTSNQASRLHMQQQDGPYRQGYNPYSMAQRKAGYPPQHPSLPPSQSPQRTTRPPRSQGPSPHRPQQHPGAGGGASNVGSSARSSSEILKTLLRKKACLYEPDTSRAVALVTWLVGRELALEHGYFSRQQLQAGVHACVAEKIESGTITRTKVNRCMQIILNSCFHYIIPRPDGTEEKGHTFREIFEKEVSDDTHLLRLLPAPWNDLIVNRDTVLSASVAEQEPRSNHGSPKGSPTLRPSQPRSPERAQADGDVADSKRAVLLCFNENVRAAEDVFRCHNEFIRDSAHSSNLQLTAQEWRIFFGKEAASTPHIWGNVGIPVVAVESPDGSGRKVDVLGQMTPEEAGKFRTTWCAKRYDHDHEFCGMAHVEVNGGWLRRDPNVHWYKDEFCPNVVKIQDKSGRTYIVNECPNGVNCKYAHSHEEMIYHPHRYKSKPCPSILRTGHCRFGDICPNHHPSDSARPSGKKGDGRPPGARHGRSSGQSSSGGKNNVTMPTGSPILYASPAPVSSFEKHLLMPGLQNLFRRQCTVVRARARNPQCSCHYSYFGDDAGICMEAPKRPSNSATGQGLPPSLRV